MFECIVCDLNGNSITEFTQWDLNQFILIEGEEYKTAPKVHFTNQNCEKALTVTSELIDSTQIKVEVPNQLLVEPYKINIYVYASEEGSSKTIQHTSIPVSKRPMPNDFEYEDNIHIVELTELEKEIKELEKAMEASEEKREANTAAAIQKADAATQKANSAADRVDSAIEATEDLIEHVENDYLPEMRQIKQEVNTTASQVSSNASAAAKSEQNAAKSETAAEKAKTEAQAAQKAIENLGVVASTLPAGSDATVEKSVADTGVTLHFGIPRGEQGAVGPRGEQGVEGPPGESGITTLTAGWFTLSVDDNGDLWAYCADTESKPPLEYDEATGALYYTVPDEVA